MTIFRTPAQDVEPLAAAQTADCATTMTEEAFREFYELTSHGLWAYLLRTSGDRRLVDDLLQESYYRLLRTNVVFESDDHRRNYLYRIATNLVHDGRRRPWSAASSRVDVEQAQASSDDGTVEVRAARRLDVARAMGHLTPRERSMLWLAYVQGCTHEEIAGVVGVKVASLKSLLFRARRRLAGLLEGGVS
jgi:RNA polymerase sigma-70 factor (ECF subfamily)